MVMLLDVLRCNAVAYADRSEKEGMFVIVLGLLLFLFIKGRGIVLEKQVDVGTFLLYCVIVDEDAGIAAVVEVQTPGSCFTKLGFETKHFTHRATPNLKPGRKSTLPEGNHPPW